MKFTPITKYILAERIEVSETNSGLALPNAMKTMRAKILEIGPDVTNNKLKIGVHVLFFRSSTINLNAALGETPKEYLMLTENDIFGVFEE